MQKVVTPNYYDRSNKEQRWLIRDPGQPAKAAVAYSAILATGVVFAASGTIESNFGCGVAAFALEAQGYENQPKGLEEPGMIPLVFNGLYFVKKDGGQIVEACDVLLLGADGSVHGIPAGEREAAKTSTKGAARERVRAS